MMQHVDYHVGLLRGFILAHNAPSIVLHALDVVLENPRSRAGEVIGEHFGVISQAEPGDWVQSAPIPNGAKFTTPQPEVRLQAVGTKFFWSVADHEELKRRYQNNEDFSDIALALGRTIASCQTRVSAYKIKRKEPA